MTTRDEQTDAAVERVPLKVVPIYVEPIIEEPEPDEEVVVEAPVVRRRPLWVVLAVIGLTIATIAVHAVAIVVSTAGDFAGGTTLAFVAVGLSALAVVGGITATVLGRWRFVAIVATIIAILANPLVLIALLRLLSGLQTA